MRRYNKGMPFSDALLEIFPPPAAILMPAAGIDIGARSVKFALLKGPLGAATLETYTDMQLKEPALQSGEILKRDMLVEVLRSFRLKHGIRYANTCLPERTAYLYQLLVPQGADIRESVEASLELHVPVPPAEVIFDFERMRSIKAGTVIAVTAYPRKTADAYASLFRDAGIVLRSLEVESQSLARAVLSEEDRVRTVMVVDFGTSATRIAIAEGGVVAFTATLDVGGNALTRAVMKNFGVEEAEAEKIKNERGFIMNRENQALVETLIATASAIKDEIARNLLYWNASSDGDIARKPVEKIIAAGGHANLRGFPEYLESSMNLPVRLANVWTNAFSLDEYVPELPFQASLEYAVPAGLALRGGLTGAW